MERCKTLLVVALAVLSVSFALRSPCADPSWPRKIILVIGHGMGPEAVGVLIYQKRFTKGLGSRSNLEKLMAKGNTGYCLTYQYGTVVTDSASAATALACGVKTRDGMIGKDHDGRAMNSILDVAKARGKSTGLISNTRITHATSAGFYAQVLHGDMESKIAEQLLDGGKRVLGLFGATAFPLAVDRQPPMGKGVPRLAEMTAKALEILSKNANGFFLMVEAGQIDWAEHANDVAAVLHEMLEMDEALGIVLEYAENHPDTLVILTADHDTGGLAIAYNSHKPPTSVKLASGETWKSKYNFNDGSIFASMASQRKSLFKRVLDSKGDPASLKREVEQHSAFTSTEEQAAAVLAKDPALGYPAPREYTHFYVYGAMNPAALLGRFFGMELGAAWAVGTHTHTPVMVMATGPKADAFRGLLDNTDIAKIMAQAWGGSLPSPK